MKTTLGLSKGATLGKEERKGKNTILGFIAQVLCSALLSLPTCRRFLKGIKARTARRHQKRFLYQEEEARGGMRNEPKNRRNENDRAHNNLGRIVEMLDQVRSFLQGDRYLQGYLPEVCRDGRVAGVSKVERNE